MMKKLAFYSFFVVVYLVAASNGFAQEDNIYHTIEYSITPDGGAHFEGGGMDAEDDDIVFLYPEPPSPAKYSFVSRVNESQSDYSGQVGAGSSCSIRESAQVDWIQVASHVQTTKRMYLSAESIDISYFWDGDLKLQNPHPLFTGDFDVEFEEEGFMELGYRISVYAESDTSYFWSTMPELGAWSYELASGEGTLFIDGETESVITTELPVDSSGNETLGFFVPVDIGKPFDVTISLDTWVTGSNFHISAEAEDSLFLLSSNFIDTLGTEVTAGATPTPIPEPGVFSMLLCLLVVGALVKTRI